MTAGSVSSNPLPVPLLATRFFAPPLPDSCVTRPRLLKRLDAGVHFPILLVSASAGFGKSLLVSEWLRTRPDLPSGWLSLQASDNDWRQFFRYLVAAWQKVSPQLGLEVLEQLRSTPNPDHETLVNGLLNDLADYRPPGEDAHLLVVLDDYHCLRNPAVHETVAYLVEHLPQNAHLVVVTRADPPLPLTRWRARGQLLELRAEDLRFTISETVEFLNRSMDLRLTTGQIEILEARTEGWIVGLQMAALSLLGREDKQGFVEAFGGSHRYVLDYLVEEVVSQQPEEIRQFLSATAILDQFCAPLCDALRDHAAPASQEILYLLEKANLFLIPLDEQRVWYRYHHLFADLLCIRLKQSQPGIYPALCLRAAQWYAEHGNWREAVDYALRAREYAQAADYVEQAISTCELRFLYSGLEPLLQQFPAEWLEQRSLLALARAATMIETSQLAGIKPLLLRVEEQLQAQPPGQNRTRLLGLVYLVQAAAASMLGDGAWILEATSRTSDLRLEDAPLNFNALIQLGNVYYYQGELRQAETCWQQALHVSQTGRYPFGILCSLENLGRLYCLVGELRQAEEYFKRTLDYLGGDENRSPRWYGSAQRDYSDLLREWNRLAEAHERMASCLPLLEAWGIVSGRGLGYLHLGRILLAKGDLPTAKNMLEKAMELCSTHTVYPDLETLVQVFHAELRAANGELDPAWKLLEDGLQQPYGQHELHREWLLIAQAKILLQSDHPAEALALLTGRLDHAREHGRGRNWLEMSLLSSLALEKLAEHAKAIEHLTAGLVYAQKRGFVRTFTEHGKAMRDLLAQFRRRGHKLLNPYVDDLLAAFPGEQGGEDAAAMLGLIEPLSAREEEILKLVCAGLSNSEISERLVLSVGTVKTHVHNIYGKLGVRDRPQAIAAAVRLGFVQPENQGRIST